MPDFAPLFEAIWSFFEVQSPFFGLTIGQFWIGVFVVGLSISMFRHFLFGGDR